MLMIIDDHPTVELTLIGRVTRGCPEFVDFGRIASGKSVRKVVPLRAWVARQGVRLLHFSHRSVKATLTPSEDSVDLVIELADDLSNGNLIVPLRLFFEAHNTECTTTVRATVTDIIEAEPARLLFTVPRRKHRVEIYSTEGQPISLRHAQAGSDSFRVVQAELATPSRIALIVEFVGGGGQDMLLDALDVEVAIDGRHRSISVPLFAVD